MHYLKHTVLELFQTMGKNMQIEYKVLAYVIIAIATGISTLKWNAFDYCSGSVSSKEESEEQKEFDELLQMIVVTIIAPFYWLLAILLGLFWLTILFTRYARKRIKKISPE